MKTQKNILIAFILNLAFSIFEFVGGILTGSVAIISDAVHDLGDAASIGLSYFLEKKSRKQPDEVYTYGYGRYSIVASAITTLILLIGSMIVIYNAIMRIIDPVIINYNGMIIFAIIGVCVNSAAAFVTHGGDSLNQRAVNLHMLEDVLGWVTVLIGAVIMKFTNISIIDPIMSIGVAAFIITNTVRNLKKILDIFLEKTPAEINIHEIEHHVSEIDGVIDVHHIHIWSLDDHNKCATMHIVTNEDNHDIKQKVRDELKEHDISHATLELEREGEHCHARHCHIEHGCCSHGHHHHHGHHH